MIFCRNFSSHSTKKIHRDTLLFFRKFLVSKTLMDKRGGRRITIFSQKCFVSQCRKISYRNLSVFHSSGYPKISGIRRVGHDNLSKNFCLTVPKKIGEESFRVSFKFGYRKILCIRGVYHDTLSEIFCLTVPRKIVQESFSVSLIRVSKNVRH